MLSPEGENQASPFHYLGIASELERGLRLRAATRWLSRPLNVHETEPTRAEWVSGASQILRTSMLEEIGLLDEGLYTYFDDVDICLRADRAGWEVWFVPQSKVIHLEGASTGIKGLAPRPKRRPAYWFQARRRFFLKSYGKLYTALTDAAFLCGFALWRLRRLVQRQPDLDPPHFLADSLRHSVFCTGFKLREVENPAMAAAPPVPMKSS
jgi:GT2 family glycosyltransferase